ncbi:carboxypeptidase regulatory-like domain-containing protein [Flavobacterium sp.]|uniref:TonB-dependent receptor n=1 Tax=Flavobacterium sp. TaxID=239 RepID=UPI00352790D0
MKENLHLFLILCFMSVFMTEGHAQGNTTASILGKVAEKGEDTLPGATIIVTHQPSGTRYTATTDDKGAYRIANMRVGGPYVIDVTYVGYKPFKGENIYLQLGDSRLINIDLDSEVSALEEVVLTGSKDADFNSKKTGAQTIIDSKRIQNLPTLSRNVSDFARLTPQAQLRGDDVISISGQNNRFNAIYIDGAVNNDVFGLAANGTNGGQTGVSPISVDAIEQFQVQVAPFDVKISGFAGGSISAITRSGTNNFEGSAYYLNRNQNLAGMTPNAISETNRSKLADFDATTIGVRAAGAIKKDKLFYFINYERQDNETPQPFEVNNYVGNIALQGSSPDVVPGLAATKIEELRNYLISNYGYDPGNYSSTKSSLVSDKFIAKVDWNINDNHKLAVRHSLVKAVNISPNRSSNTAINFYNGAQEFTSTTNSSSIELSSRFSDRVSNSLVLGYTSVKDDRNALGDPFPYLEIRDGLGTIFVGSEPFSTANLLEQNIFTFTDNVEIQAGINTITIGTHNEFSSSKNVFFGRNYGYYRYSNLQDFLDNNKPNRFRIGYSLVGGDGDGSQGAAEFDVVQFGGYLQNEMRLSDNFRLSYGFRVDVPVWDDYIVNEDFNNRTIPLLEAAGKDLKGAKVGSRIDTRAHISPRLGFNYDVSGKKTTQIRGGLGIFTSRLPLVWPGGAYNNNGVTQGTVDINGATNPNMPDFNSNTSVSSQIAGLPSNIAPAQGNPGAPGQFSGAVDLFAKDFKLPQVFKANLAIDQKLPLGIRLTTDFTYNDNISAITYENINLREPASNLTGADNRPRYNANNRIDNTYQGIYLASNTNEGKSWNAAFTLTRNFITDKIDASIQATYSYGESTTLFDATSSQNSSQWNNIETVNGSNAIGRVARSDFDQGHRVLANSFVTYKWNKNLKTRIGLFYEGTEGTPISYVYNDNGRLLSDTFSNSALIYVPASQSEIVLVTDPSTGLDPQQQWDALNTFIEGNDYLRSKRGNYAERNGDRLKWSHVIDLKFAQEFILNIKNKKHTFELTTDIFNFTNLLNKDWGKRYFATFDQVQLLNQVGFLADGTTPTFRYNPAVEQSLNQVDDQGLNSSRWQMQIGVRYTFN